jgi:replication fork protection complex subunit Csm3/Swi3
MLNMYQLWLDDLYPRAKFADALAIIEKVGHTKSMQLHRKDWIDEGKPRRATQQDEDEEEGASETPVQQSTEAMEGVEKSTDHEDTEASAGPGGSAQKQASQGAEPATAGEPDDDELDALLAESAEPSTAAPKTLPTRTAPAQDDPFADEMEAMADMDDLW